VIDCNCFSSVKLVGFMHCTSKRKLGKGAMPGQCTRFKPFQRFKTNVALRVQREALEIKAICDSATTTVPLATVVKLIQFSLAPLCGN
jgi:hypothetical protein